MHGAEFIIHNFLMKTKKIYYILGLITMLLAGCSGDDSLLTTDEPGTRTSGNVITLGVKEVKSPVTRAQHTGSMDFAQLETTGFGVYGYEGDAEYNYSTKEYNLFAPNTPVTFISGGTPPTTNLDIPGSWKYTDTAEGLKEWKAGKKYTFFAYAPYMAEGGTAPGITSVSAGNGDPTIGYTVAEDPASSVDLLWGVRTDTSDKTGLPWIDIQKGQTTSAVLFTFYHALCAIGLHAQVMVDQKNDTDNLGDLSQLGKIGDADGCKVTLKSITITPKGFPNAEPAVAATLFHKSAKLNLNNTNTPHQPKWTEKTGTIAKLVLDDGSTDGHGAIDDSLLDPNPSDFSDANPSNTSVMSNTSVPGITESANTQAIIAGDNMFMLIPQDAQDYDITIEYFLTYKTEIGYHREAKTGTAKIKNLELAAGMKYYLNLVFGLTTFKLNVMATDWVGETQNTTVVIETGTSAGNSLAK